MWRVRSNEKNRTRDLDPTCMATETHVLGKTKEQRLHGSRSNSIRLLEETSTALSRRIYVFVYHGLQQSDHRILQSDSLAR